MRFDLFQPLSVMNNPCLSRHACACPCARTPAVHVMESHRGEKSTPKQSSPLDVLCLHPPPRANIFLISPPGGGVPGGSDPTVDTLALPLVPTLWYYLVAAGGALILLAVAVLARALCCHRRRLAAKKSQLSVAYHSQSQYFQYSQCSASNPVTAAPGTEPVLTVRLDNHGHQTYALC